MPKYYAEAHAAQRAFAWPIPAHVPTSDTDEMFGSRLWPTMWEDLRTDTNRTMNKIKRLAVEGTKIIQRGLRTETVEAFVRRRVAEKQTGTEPERDPWDPCNPDGVYQAMNRRAVARAHKQAMA
jgi:hypothetical protein